MIYQLIKTVECSNDICCMVKHKIGNAVEYNSFDIGYTHNLTDLNVAFRLMELFNKNENNWCDCKAKVETAL